MIILNDRVRSREILNAFDFHKFGVAATANRFHLKHCFAIHHRSVKFRRQIDFAFSHFLKCSLGIVDINKFLDDEKPFDTG